MSKKIISLLAIILLSCAHQSNYDYENSMRIVNDIQKNMEITEEYWNVSGQVPKTNGVCLKDFSVLFLSDDEFKHKCGITSFMSDGCIVNKGRVGNLLNKKIIYVSVKHDKKSSLLAMYLHALSSCVPPINKTDKYDFSQFRPYVWYRVSGKQSFEHKLKELLCE